MRRQPSISPCVSITSIDRALGVVVHLIVQNKLGTSTRMVGAYHLNVVVEAEDDESDGGVVDEEVGDDVGDGVVDELLSLLSHSTATWCPAAPRALAEVPPAVMCRIDPSSN